MKNILIIEDSQDIRLFLSNVLKKENFTVESCSNGEEAVSKIESKQKKKEPMHYDLILLDLMMPKMNGQEFLKQPLELEESKILVISAKNDPNIIKECLNLGASDYIIKPIDKDILIDKVKVLLSDEEEEFATIDTRLPLYIENDTQFQGMLFTLSEAQFKFLSNTKFSTNQVIEFICEDLSALTGNSSQFYGRIVQEEIKGRFFSYTAMIIGLKDNQRTKLRMLTQAGKRLHYKNDMEL